MKLICKTDKLKSIQKGMDCTKYVLSYAIRGVNTGLFPVRASLATLVQLSINGKANTYKLANFDLVEESTDKL